LQEAHKFRIARIAFKKDTVIYIPKSNPNIGILDYFLGDSFSFAEPGDLTQILYIPQEQKLLQRSIIKQELQPFLADSQLKK